MKYILLCGGLGYIGSHIIIECVNNGFIPIIIDNLYNCDRNKIAMNVMKFLKKYIQNIQSIL